jgi:hypothetical protein
MTNKLTCKYLRTESSERVFQAQPNWPPPDAAHELWNARCFKVLFRLLGEGVFFDTAKSDGGIYLSRR